MNLPISLFVIAWYFAGVILNFAGRLTQSCNNSSGPPCFLNSSEDISVTAIFEDIQRQILEQIESAEFLIWVAVAWFTDPVLLDALAKQKITTIHIAEVVDFMLEKRIQAACKKNKNCLKQREQKNYTNTNLN